MALKLTSIFTLFLLVSKSKFWRGFRRSVVASKILFILILNLFALVTFAQSKIAKSTSSVSKTDIHVNGSARFEFSKFPSSWPDNPKLDQSSLATVFFRADQRTSNFRNFADFSAGKYVDWGGSQFAVQELFNQSNWMQNKLQVSVGRKIEFWSQVDMDWQLGLWEPKFNLDALRPVNQGLTGVFVKYRTVDFEILGFVTPMFIPTMGPEIREKDGSLVSDNRWYKTPSKSSIVMGRNTELLYSLDVPNIGKLVSNPGLGFRFLMGGQSEGPWVSFNMARKPINNLILRYDANLAITTSASSGQVVVGPEVGYHFLGGFDVGYYLEKGTMSFSYLQDDPSEVFPVNTASTDWVQQVPGRLRIYGMHYETNMKVPWDREPMGVTLDYIRVVEKATRDVDALGEDRGSLFPFRTNFTNALNIRSSIQSMIMKKKLLSSLRVLREFDQNGTILGAELNYFPYRSWAFIMGADAIAVDTANGNADPRFINQFRANDRVFGGFHYVF